jgi:hypothetical protein
MRPPSETAGVWGGVREKSTERGGEGRWGGGKGEREGERERGREGGLKGVEGDSEYRRFNHPRPTNPKP